MSLKEERDQLFLDVCSGKKPKRVPIFFGMQIDAAIEYFGYSLLKDVYSPQICYEVADRLAPMIDSDVLPVSPFNTYAAFRYLDQKFMTPGKDGSFQHPDLAPMEREEYPEFSKNILDFIVDKIQPRVFGIIKDDPKLGQVRMKIARDVVVRPYIGMAEKLSEKYERSSVMKSYTILWAPFDFIADYIRSFSEILKDVRKEPQWVLEACEAVCDYEIAQVRALPDPKEGEVSQITIPLHMPPFMRPKDVEKFYWPTFRRFILAVQEKGFIPNVFCEGNWDPHLDLLQDIPGRAIFSFEDSNQKLIAERVPTRHIYMHSYPTMMMKNGSPKECVNEVKRTLDNLAGAGNYIFCPNKTLMRGADINIENIRAVIDCVREYGQY